MPTPVENQRMLLLSSYCLFYTNSTSFNAICHTVSEISKFKELNLKTSVFNTQTSIETASQFLQSSFYRLQFVGLLKMVAIFTDTSTLSNTILVSHSHTACSVDDVLCKSYSEVSSFVDWSLMVDVAIQASLEHSRVQIPHIQLLQMRGIRQAHRSMGEKK